MLLGGSTLDITPYQNMPHHNFFVIDPVSLGVFITKAAMANLCIGDTSAQARMRFRPAQKTLQGLKSLLVMGLRSAAVRNPTLEDNHLLVFCVSGE